MLTYGLLGMENMKAALAHEIGHIFGAWDEYGIVTAVETYGFLQVENGNVSGKTNHMPCIMHGGIDPFKRNQICYFTKGQIGWRDKDDDNILDCIDSSFNPSVDSDRNGIVDYWDGPFVVGPRRAKVLVGSSRRFYAIGGRPPYTWSSSDTAVGSIGPYTGEFEARSPGATIVTVTDAEGRSARDPVVVEVVDVADTPPDVPLLVMPLDNSSGQDTSLVLVWAGSDPDGDAITYDVYFGETAQLDSTNLVLKDYFWTDCSVEGLRPGTTYYWKIVGSDGQSRVAGPVWSFGTKFRYKLRLAGYNIDDVSGDNDGKLDPGETIKLTVRLRNFGRDVSKLSVFLNSDDPAVVILSDSSSIYIPPGETATAHPPYAVTLKAPEEYVSFTLRIVSDLRDTIGTESFDVPVDLNKAVRAEVRNTGPYGGRILGLFVDPQNHNILYAYTFNAGIFKTLDGGESWFPINDGLQSLEIRSFAIDPSNPSILYTSTWGRTYGIYKSVNGGHNWDIIETASSELHIAYRLAVDPSNSSIIYAVACKGLFKSTDGGATWQPIGRGLCPSGDVKTNIIFDPLDPETMYIGSYRAIYKSTNGGLDWKVIKRGNIHSLGINPSDGTIYACVDFSILKSTDGGQSWTVVAPDLYASSFAFDPFDPKVTYIRGDGCIYKSTDGGTSWSRVDSGLNFVHYGTYSYGIYQKPKSNKGIAATDVYDLALDPVDPNIIYAATRSGVWRSEDGGETWELRDNGIEGRVIYGLEVNPADHNILYACGGGGVYKSFDGGLRWSKLLEFGCCMAIAISEVDPNVLYVVMNDYDHMRGEEIRKILRTEDGGISWDDFSNGIPRDFSFDIVDLKVDPHSPYAVFLVHERQGPYKTTGYSPNWKPMGEGDFASTGRWSDDIEITPEGIIYLAGTGSFGGVFKSVDGGETWAKVNEGITGGSPSMGAIAIDPTNPNVLYAGTNADIGEGLFRSVDAGLHWEKVCDDLREAWITCIEVTPDGRTLYVGTEGRGVYRIDVGTSPATSVAEGYNVVPTKFSLGHNYPNPFNPITQIPYQLPCKSKVEICIYNLLGQKVRTLVDEVQKAGYHKVIWDGRDKFGREVASGVYLCRMEAAPKPEGRSFVRTIKMLLLR